jgi:hypothetical protein
VKSRATEDARTSLQVTRIDILRFHARARISEIGEGRKFRLTLRIALSSVAGRIVVSRLPFDEPANGNETGVIVAASTVAIVAIAAAVMVVALLARYVLPAGRPPKAVTSKLGGYRASCTHAVPAGAASTRTSRLALPHHSLVRGCGFGNPSSAGSPESAARAGFASRSGSWANSTTPEA